MSVTLSESENSSVIRLEGSIDIAEAVELKTVLLEAFQCGKTVEVDVEGVTGLDVTAAQLLWAARRNAEKLRVEFRLIGRFTEAVLVALDGAGLKEVCAVS